MSAAALGRLSCSLLGRLMYLWSADRLELYGLEWPSVLCDPWSLASMLASLAASNSIRLPKEVSIRLPKEVSPDVHFSSVCLHCICCYSIFQSTQTERRPESTQRNKQSGENKLGFRGRHTLR